MRSSISILVTLALALSSLAGCGGSDTPNVSHDPAKPSTSGGGSSSNGGTSSGSGGGSSSGGGSGGGSGFGDGSGSSGGSGGASVKRVFVTSTTYSGNLGGVSGADNKCQLHADAASLGGTWKAWISGGSANAIDRIADVGPWYLVDRTTKVFNNKANLQTTPAFAIWSDETGAAPSWSGMSSPWSGSDEAGHDSGWDCNGWTSALTTDYATTGDANTDQAWGGATSGPIECDFTGALICFEQ